MLSRLTVKGISAFFALTRQFHCFPFQWKKEELRTRDSIIVTLVHAFYSCWIVVYSINIAVSLVDAVKEENDIMRIVLDFLFLLHFLCDFAMSICIRKNREGNALFFTSLLKCDREFSEILQVPKQKFNGLEVVWVFASSIVTIPFSCIAFFIVQPDSKRYLYHRLPTRFKTKTTFLMWSCIEYWTHAMNLASMNFYIIESFIYLFMTDFYTRLLLKLALTRQNRRSILQVLKSIRILDTFAFRYLAPLFLPLIILIIIVTGTVGLYGIIMLHGKVSVYGFALFPAVATLCIFGAVQAFHRAGRMYTASVALLHSLQYTCPQEKYTSKLCKSIYPSQFLVGHSFTVEPTYVLCLLVIITNSVINLILLHK